ncbi:snare associated Golgi protein-domain-containing protein [Hyaloraphidium curvatum]|nr:snare associated Golgi protein-domain-containing protein [Hyaloraphidium curvatum]
MAAEGDGEGGGPVLQSAGTDLSLFEAGVDLEEAIADLDDSDSEDSPLSPASAARSQCLPQGLLPSTSLLPRSLGSALKVFGLVVGPVTLFLLLPDFHFQQHLFNALKFIQHHKVPGALIFVAIYALCTVILLPVSLLSIGAGVIFTPVWLGVMVVMAAVAAGSMACFVLGRYLLRSKVQEWLASKAGRFAAIDRAMSSSDARGIVVLLRMSPIVPFAILNYVLSLTDLAWADFLMTASLGSLPSVCMAVVMGSFLGDLAGASAIEQVLDRRTTYLVMYLSTLLILVTSVLITLLSRRALRRVLTRQPTAAVSMVKMDTAEAADGLDLYAPNFAPNAAQFTPWERRTLWWTCFGALVGLVVGCPLVLMLTSEGDHESSARMADRVVDRS